MAGEEPGYIDWLHSTRCVARFRGAGGACHGPLEAHHAGRKGIGQRPHDSTAIPLCQHHHRSLHSLTGCFRGWTKERRREWLSGWLEKVRSAWDAHRARRASSV